MTENPKLDDCLPRYSDTDCGKIEPECTIGVAVETSSKLPKITFPDADSYGVTAQAVYLLGRVVDYIRRPLEIQDQNLESIFLDDSLQDMAISILRQAESKAKYTMDLYCTAYGVCIL